MVGFEGPLGGQTQVLGLFVGQLGQLHSQFVQMGGCHLLIQLSGDPQKFQLDKTGRLLIIR